MTLYHKTIIIISVTLLGLAIILYFISQTILLNSFIELERAGVQRNIERASIALFNQMIELDTTAGDWAPWDETYTFVETPNEAYIRANLGDSTFLNLNLNFMLFFNTSEQLVFARAFDLERQTEVEVPQNLQDHFARNDLLFHHPNPQSSITGVILLPNEAPVLVASRPIVTNDYQGPIRGTLIIGRYLDTAQIEALGEQTKLNLSISRVDDFPLLNDSQTAQAALLKEPSIFIQPLDEETIVGYNLIKDVYGQPGLILTIEMSRAIYSQGQITFYYLIAAFLVSGLLFGIVLLFLLNKGLVSRLTSLDRRVKDIATYPDLTARVLVTGQDEISSLGNSINSLLTTLQFSEETLRQSYQALESRVEERTAELSETNRLLRIEIGERKRIEQALVQARDHALEASRLKTELLAKVSHELRTPLTIISGYAEMLQLEMDGPLVEEQHASLEHIIESTHYLTQHVGELLDQARLETGKIGLDITTFVLIDIIERVHAQMQVLAQSKGLTLTIEVAEDLPVKVTNDPVRLQQILVNLIDNALKFTAVGSVQVCIRRSEPDHWVIRVTDTGPGIPVEAQTYIFEPFRQLDGSLTRQYSGVGLGLSIVKQIGLLMGGEIFLESQVGQGSTFTVRLPLVVAPEDPNVFNTQ